MRRTAVLGSASLFSYLDAWDEDDRPFDEDDLNDHGPVIDPLDRPSSEDLNACLPENQEI